LINFAAIAIAIASRISGHLRTLAPNAESDANIYGGELGKLIAVAYIGACLQNSKLLDEAHELATLWSRNLKLTDEIGGLIDGRIATVFSNLLFWKIFQDQGFLLRAEMELGAFPVEMLSAQFSQKPYDLLYGEAGVLLCLGCGSRELNSNDINNRILSIGTSIADSLSGMKDPEVYRMLGIGMAHGMSGTSLALYEAGRLVGSEFMVTQAFRLMTIESGYYDERMQDWGDGFSAVTHAGPSWCRSAVGIGFSRLMTIQSGNVRQSVVETDVARAISASLGAGALSYLRSLCCGSWGRVEFLRRAAMQLNEPALKSMAVHLGSVLLAENSGSTDISGNGLFRGWGGVGCVAAALVAERNTPSLLAFELWR
jgi:lantibiotic modifying enzyme